MKILILMGSPRLQGNTAELCKPFIQELKERGAEVKYLELENMNIGVCKGCYKCQNVAGEYGCVQKDDMYSIVEDIVWADCIILATPIYSWYCTSKMKMVLDRHYGLNKYYGNCSGSLWEGKKVGILATHGYEGAYATDPFETGIKRLCKHSKLQYLGMYSVRDTDNKASFQTAEAVEGARAFATSIMEKNTNKFTEKRKTTTGISIFEDTMVTENWQKVEKAASQKCPVLFPLGVIEEHGPHLPLGADIYWSYNICRMVKDKLRQKGCESVIAPPYYWGVNHCTGGFPGSFSLKMETMQQVLFEIFENLQNFGFSDVYCFSYHGDSIHVRAIEGAVKKANKELDIHVKLVLESMDLQLYGWRGDEDFLLVSEPDYPMEWFEEQEPSERGLLDIHAGAYETAVLNHMCSEQVDLEMARGLKSSSLTKEGLKKWLMGSEVTKEVVPLGYAGNPAGYETVSKHVEEMLDMQTGDIAGRIYSAISTH